MSDMLTKYYMKFHQERKKSGTVSDPKRLAFIIKNVGSGKRVLELGCRYGDLMSHYIDGNDVVGVDIDAHALKICSERYGVKTMTQDLNKKLDLKDEEFDVVVLSEVLEHLPYPDISLAEARRTIKKNGLLVGSVPNGTRLRNRMRFMFEGVVEDDQTHLFHYSRKSLGLLLRKHFNEVTIPSPVSGRFVALSPDMFGNYILFKAKK